ncbi:MFS transporter (macronuclear) [Tetrahymena thermophila SB210]|uniref:MFS transporter n=1 Tax=Tetrahymena thermophila (strain SB210) TaxID=312017 RepID=Q245X0_TETTS|nr:MFS transporter [Tetrahymena thermophila SB210]EAS03513.1 MFS transporter [Tetrahymena thermophila SB210]|eukprot:XP_001023758.1 MFS transporter [Tetrahymena thermophila SB210]
MAIKNPLRKLSFETKGWITLFSGFCLHFVLGTFYLWGSISTYTASYLQQNGQNYNAETVGAVFPFTYLSLNLGTPIGVYFASKIGFNPFIFIGSILIGICTIVSSYVIDIFPLFVLFYGVLFGFISGLLYMLPFNSCYLYMPHRKGLVSGVIVGGFGFGSTAFIWLIYSIVNPHNAKATDLINGAKYFSKDITDQFPDSLRVLGIVQIFIGIFSSFLHIRPTQEELKQQEEKNKIRAINQNCIEELQQQQFILIKAQSSIETQTNQNNQNQAITEMRGTATESEILRTGTIPQEKNNCQAFEQNLDQQKIVDNQSQLAAQKGAKKNQNEEVYHEFQTMKEGLMTKFIYITVALALMYTIFGILIISNYKVYGEYQNYTDNFLSTVGTVGSVFNGLGRFFWGSLMEKLTIRQIIIINLIFQIIVSFTFSWAAQNAALYLIYVVLAYFLYGGWFSIFPTLVARVYGKKIGTQIYGITFFGYTIASFLQYFVLIEIKNAAGWRATFWIFTGIQIFAIIISQFVKFNSVPPQKQKEFIQAEIEKQKSNEIMQLP